MIITGEISNLTHHQVQDAYPQYRVYEPANFSKNLSRMKKELLLSGNDDFEVAMHGIQNMHMNGRSINAYSAAQRNTRMAAAMNLTQQGLTSSPFQTIAAQQTSITPPVVLSNPSSASNPRGYATSAFEIHCHLETVERGGGNPANAYSSGRGGGHNVLDSISVVSGVNTSADNYSVGLSIASSANRTQMTSASSRCRSSGNSRIPHIRTSTGIIQEEDSLMSVDSSTNSTSFYSPDSNSNPNHSARICDRAIQILQASARSPPVQIPLSPKTSYTVVASGSPKRQKIANTVDSNEAPNANNRKRPPSHPTVTTVDSCSEDSDYLPSETVGGDVEDDSFLPHEDKKPAAK